MGDIAYRAADYALVFDGQSLNENAFNPSTAWTHTVLSTRTNGRATFDLPWIEGYSWDNLYNGNPTGSFPFAQRAAPFMNLAPFVIYTMIGGSTDCINGTAAATTYATEGQLAAAARAAGANYVIGTTTTPSTSITGGNETIRTTLNALVLADAGGHFDAVVDLAGHPDLDDPSNTTYYTDGIHPTAAGHAIIAGLMGAAIDTALSGAGITP